MDWNAPHPFHQPLLRLRKLPQDAFRQHPLSRAFLCFWGGVSRETLTFVACEQNRPVIQPIDPAAANALSARVLRRALERLPAAPLAPDEWSVLLVQAHLDEVEAWAIQRGASNPILLRERVGSHLEFCSEGMANWGAVWPGELIRRAWPTVPRRSDRGKYVEQLFGLREKGGPEAFWTFPPLPPRREAGDLLTPALGLVAALLLGSATALTSSSSRTPVAFAELDDVAGGTGSSGAVDIVLPPLPGEVAPSEPARPEKPKPPPRQEPVSRPSPPVAETRPRWTEPDPDPIPKMEDRERRPLVPPGEGSAPLPKFGKLEIRPAFDVPSVPQVRQVMETGRPAAHDHVRPMRGAQQGNAIASFNVPVGLVEDAIRIMKQCHQKTSVVELPHATVEVSLDPAGDLRLRSVKGSGLDSALARQIVLGVTCGR